MSSNSLVKKILRKLMRNDNHIANDLYSIPVFDRVDIQRGCIISTDSIIGKYTYVGFNSNITRAKIGNYCSIASLVSIGDGEHPLTDISTNGLFYNNGYETLTDKECIIGNDVWIGTQSVIRRGVTIGNGAVVGANSFVNKDVPDFAVVGGSPAKVIKYRFDKTVIDIIDNSKWWNLDFEDAKIIIEKIKNNSI